MKDNMVDVFSNPDQRELLRQYEQLKGIRFFIVNDLKNRIEQVLLVLNSPPIVIGRIKNFESYFRKYISILKTGNNTPCITDLIGIRIVCPFIEDLTEVERLIKINFNVTEAERKGHYTFKEFGYESTHLLIKIPEDIINTRGKADCEIAEIQIRTILQDAWAEVEHELVYKAEFTPFDEPMKRKLAAVNASLSLADLIFQEIRSYQRQLNSELEKRRESFFQKIEESTDALLFSEENAEKIENTAGYADFEPFSGENVSIDDLLLRALSAHNKNNFDEAASLYSRILEHKPDNTISSIIFKHRGMAHFACSKYTEAIDDFNHALELDSKSYKAAYYRGVVNSVVKKYSQAIDDFTNSLIINPYQPFCLFRRGQAYYHIGDYPKALSDCDSSIALEPNNDAVHKFKDLLKDKLKM